MTSSRLESDRSKLLVNRGNALGKLRNIGSFLRFNLKLSHKGMILVSVPLFFELLFLGILATLLNQSELEAKRSEHSREIIGHCNSLTHLLYDSGTTIARLTITGGRMFADRYESISTQIPQEFDELDKLVADDPIRREQLGVSRNVANTLLDLLNEYKESLGRGERLAAILRGKEMAQQVNTLLDELIKNMNEFVEPDLQAQKKNFDKEVEYKKMVKAFLLIGIFFNVFLAFSVAIFFSKSVTSRLFGVTENTRRLARGEDLSPIQPGSDEIAHLDRVFHDMAAALAEAARKEKEVMDALRASESRVRQIIDSMPVGLVVIDGKGIIESVNPTMELIFGYTPEELIGHHLMMLFPHPLDEDSGEFMKEIFEKSLGHIEEKEAVKSNGELFPTELSLNKFQTIEGERFLANILDLTERKEVERLKREFVSTVSHELRTPLTAIRGSLTLMTAGAVGELNDQMRKVVTIAERNTIRLIGLINDLLDLEKLEAGKLDMHFDEVPFASVIERSVESVRAFGDQHGVAIEAESSDAVVYADGDRLVQVIVNLLSNAIKFSAKGSTVNVQVKLEDKSLTVSVVDTGRGIPEKYKALLFQRFQQVEVADAKKRGGTGLGLAICKQIIEQHKGTIGVESEEGKGSTFWFRIPTTDNSKE